MQTPAPATAEWFMENGATSPEQAAELARQSSDPSAWSSLAANASAPRGAPPVAAPAAIPSAQAELDQLTADRAAGKISDYAWREKSARLDELVQAIAGNTAPVDSLAAAGIGPPRASWDYPVPPTRTELSDAQHAEIGKMNQAYLAEGLSTTVVKMGYTDAYAAQGRNETEQQMVARVEATKTALKGMWGGEYDARIASLTRYLDDVAERRPELSSAVTSVLQNGSAITLDRLWIEIKQRASRRQ